MRKLLLATLILLTLAVSPVQAQIGSQAALVDIDLSAYPTLSVFLDASGPDGAFLEGLGPNQITLLEDDQPVEITQLLAEQPGVEVIVAINAAPAMAIRDSTGTNRYEHVLAALQAWLALESESESGSYSFLANGIQPARSLPDRPALAQALSRYLPDFKRALPGLESLTGALNIALTPPSEPGTARFILYVTPPPENEQVSALSALRAQAEESGARIVVWMVASRNLFDSPGARELAALADSSGGYLFGFSGVEEIPGPDPALQGLGRIYSLQYRSQIQSGPSHTLVAEINLDGEILRTQALPFELEVLPPSPMFLSPPASIERSAPAGSENPLSDLSPRSFTLQALVEFPDGRTRPLTSSRLYVDGKQIVELTEPPFEQFVWDLGSYTSGGSHILRLEVEDSYGLKGSTLELPVDITVNIPELSLWEQVTRPKTLASLGAFVAAALILAFVLFLVGRIRSGPHTSRRADLDPVTQPVHDHKAPRSRETGLLWRRPPDLTAGAVLLPLGENNEPAQCPAIPLPGSEVTFGRDANLASVVLDSPTVDNLHARMKCTGGIYTLADNGTVAGTWVNYAPISREGTRLEHGDIIHFGRLAYRFLLSQPGQPRQPTVRAHKG